MYDNFGSISPTNFGDYTIATFCTWSGGGTIRQVMIGFRKSAHAPEQLPGANQIYVVRLDINKIYMFKYSRSMPYYFSDYDENPTPITPNDVGKTIDFAILLSL